MSIYTYQLLDGTSIPWLAWGSGTGLKGSEDTIEEGMLAIKSGIYHIDTAQLYKTESEIGEAIRRSAVDKDQIYVTSKLSWDQAGKPVPLNEVRARVEGSVKRLGFIPDLFLIHNPFIPAPGELRAMWKIFEDLKDEGRLKSIGVSNFRPQDLEVILTGTKHKPVVNQLEFHPYTLAHLTPLLALQEKHGIVTKSYGSLSPILRHPTGGPLKPVLEKIAARLSQEKGKLIDATSVLIFWVRAQNVVLVGASWYPQRIEGLAELAKSPQLLTDSDIAEISDVGKKIHFRFY
ncbi:conjugated polyketone reductase C1, partial [Macrolepiota fuliginosa MF-IS2]